MNRVPGLKPDNRLPPALLKSSSRLSRHAVIVFKPRQRRRANQADGSAYQEIASLVQVLHTRMARLFSAIDQARLRSLIIGKNLLHREQSQQFAVRAQ